MVIPERRAAHVTEVVAKTAAGATEHLPIARVTNLANFIEKLKRHNVWVVGVEASGDMDYTRYDYAGAVALVFGGEGHGLHRLVRERCDVTVSIPLHGRITSLNVSVAVGVSVAVSVAVSVRVAVSVAVAVGVAVVFQASGIGAADPALPVSGRP